MSIEEKVEEQYKKILDSLGIRHYGKTENINDAITKALKEAKSKSGNSGNNFPDIKIMIDDSHGRYLPVMIEAKGSKKKLHKLDKDGFIQGPVFDDEKQKMDYSAVINFAVNGAVHYANAILDEGTYKEVIAVGINGTSVDKKGKVIDPECEAYYISAKNNRIPKKIEAITANDWALFKSDNADKLFDILDKLNLSEKELEDLTRKTEITLEEKIKAIHQSIYDNQSLKTALTTNEKLYLFCGLIMAGLKTTGIKPLEVNDFTGNNNERNNDGHLILTNIESFLCAKNCTQKKVEMILSLLNSVFKKKVLWQPKNGESILKALFKQVKQDVIPCLESNLHLDFTGRILNSLSDWVRIENDTTNDVVLTPRYATNLMAKLAKTDMNSFVWDACLSLNW